MHNDPVNLKDLLGLYEILAEKDGAYIIIEEGDTLWSIIKGQSPYASDAEIVSRIQDIASLNGLSNPDKIKPDEMLKAPNSVVPDITEDLFNKMRTNASDFWISNPFYFKSKVKSFGDWDFKRDTDSIYCTKPLQYGNYIFNGEIVRYDAPGNIHYGYVGKAAWWSWDSLLFEMAGVAQMNDNPGGNWTKDDSYDAYCIQMGIDLYKSDKEKGKNK